MVFIFYSSLLYKIKPVYIRKWRYGLQEMTGRERGLKFTQREIALSVYHKVLFSISFNYCFNLDLKNLNMSF